MNTLRNFFERMKEKFSGEEFHYAEKELMHFWGKVERTLEILEIWFGNFNSPNQDVTELKEYYDNMRGEFNQNVLENVDNLTNALYEMENYIFNHPDDIKPGGAFIKLLFDIENMDKDNPDYWGKDKRKLIIALCNTYEKNEKTLFLFERLGIDGFFVKFVYFDCEEIRICEFQISHMSLGKIHLDGQDLNL